MSYMHHHHKGRHRARNLRWTPNGVLEFFDTYFLNAQDARDFACKQEGFTVKIYNDDGELVEAMFITEETDCYA